MRLGRLRVARLFGHVPLFVRRSRGARLLLFLGLLTALTALLHRVTYDWRDRLLMVGKAVFFDHTSL
jgi:hypothetical protein